ncbi:MULTISPECIES: DUF6525 family protein [unclassified Mameliella]|uniref:DUF6525 family protein n=1 Tax=unclassified Mameliella TaxID=2630630 RepID=UPI00273D9C53|nr:MULTISPECIES: DUF6525 family protein [unclassified Mameliella]
MAGRRNGNRGAVAITPRRRKRDPMRVYDGLPAPLRRWMAGAVLPWSPESCLAIWRRADCPDEALERLNRAERATLERAGL